MKSKIEIRHEADIINDVFERLKSAQAFEILSNCNS
jgi:hypothetical protein